MNQTGQFLFPSLEHRSCIKNEYIISCKLAILVDASILLSCAACIENRYETTTQCKQCLGFEVQLDPESFKTCEIARFDPGSTDKL